MIQIKKAKRSAAKIKIGMAGISGTGKTMSALLMGYGLIKAAHPGMSEPDLWEKILVIDTENKSASLYAGKRVGSMRIGEFLTIEIGAPFTAQKYMDAIQAAQDAGVEYLIIDSMSHVWNAEGGMLEMQANVAKRTGNSYTAWRDVTPLFNQLMNKILQCDMHTVMTFRSKKEYAIEEENGRKKVTAKGMGITFREGNDYETTIFFELDQNHTAYATKDRTGIFDQRYFVISPETGKEIWEWLSTAEKPVPVPKPKKVEETHEADDEPPVAEAENDGEVTLEMVDQVIKARCAGMSKEDKKAFAQSVKEITGGVANYMTVTDPAIIVKLYEAFKD